MKIKPIILLAVLLPTAAFTQMHQNRLQSISKKNTNLGLDIFDE